MFFPPEPLSVYEIVGGSYAADFLGPRKGGVGGNEAAFRAFQRAYKNDTPVSQLMKTGGGRQLLQAYRDRLERLSITEADRAWYRTLSIKDMETRWSQFLFTTKLARTLPQSVDFTYKLAKSSAACRQLWDDGERASAFQMLTDLPWAHTDTMQWYLAALRTNERDLPEAWHLPAQMMGMIAALQMMILEGRERSPTQDDAWSFAEMMAARYPGTGHLAAIRYYLERTKAATEIETNFDFDERAFSQYRNQDTRQREAKKFRAGKVVPSHQTCLNINENMRSDMSEKSAGQLFILANVACFFQKAFDRLQKNRELTLDPMTLFDDYQAFREMPKERLQEATNLAASHTPAMTP
ncbi:hypothetical protein FGK63_20250 [Ruegeria sediminis]|uniref:DUF4034 domain-containing protein n=1 Tax=Ruegeria sediminis TaxID=2583820 RepID=A0ABY2WRZ7_9RHOB|nr:hypothetical protein [Ruegeria sediminis]TMV02563.1 hypothetical protein FGK63_20250 [Ruegeria sediminis]